MLLRLKVMWCDVSLRLVCVVAFRSWNTIVQCPRPRRVFTVFLFFLDWLSSTCRSQEVAAEQLKKTWLELKLSDWVYFWYLTFDLDHLNGKSSVAATLDCVRLPLMDIGRGCKVKVSHCCCESNTSRLWGRHLNRTRLRGWFRFFFFVFVAAALRPQKKNNQSNAFTHTCK